MRLDLFIKLKYQSNTKISVGIKYSLSDLLLTSITMPDPQTSESVTYKVYDVSAVSGISLL